MRTRSDVRGAKPVARVWFAFPGGGWSDSLGRMVPPADPDTLSPAELKALVGALLSQVTELERTVAAQREEIARLKGLKGRPPIKPSGMEQATEPKPPRGAQGRGRGKVEPRVAVEERVLQVLSGFAPSGRRSAILAARSGVRLGALLSSSGSGGNKIAAMPSVGASADRTAQRVR